MYFIENRILFNGLVKLILIIVSQINFCFNLHAPLLMNRFLTTTPKMFLLILSLSLSFSCSKDADLLSDYVIADKGDIESIALLVDDRYFIQSGQHNMVLDVLNNDSFGDNNQVNIVETSTPMNGEVVINTDNTITYTPSTPEPIENKTPEGDTFTYTTEVSTSDIGTLREQATVTITVSEMGELKAFPNAYGAGAFSSGGRGQSVYKVTTLANSGAGSFREAVSVSNRTIVFEVSGTIDLTSPITITADNLTIAGQTAPQGGIAITGSNVFFQTADNIILRYVRFRPDYNSSGSVDALNVFNCDNMILDHISVSWGGDEALSIIGDSDFVTISNSIIGESATGMILGNGNSDISENMSLLGNIFYNISHRFPNGNANRLDVINNLVHNWNTRLIVNGTYDGSQLNQINNYYQRSSRSTSVLTSNVHETNWLDIGRASNRPNMRIYTSGNIINDVMAATDNQTSNGFWRVRFNITGGTYAGTNQWDLAPSDFFVNTPYPLLGADYPTVAASVVLTEVPKEAGANRTLDGSGNITKDWDVIDDRYLGFITSNTYDTYSYPPVAIVNKSHYTSYKNSITTTPVNSREASYDTDNDGMPDFWEISRFGNLSRDGRGDINGNGYTDLEEFLNLVDF